MRRPLLLGIPGSLRCLVCGPHGTVLASTDAGVAVQPSMQGQLKEHLLSEQGELRTLCGRSKQCMQSAQPSQPSQLPLQGGEAEAASQSGEQEQGHTNADANTMLGPGSHPVDPQAGVIDLRGQLSELNFGPEGPMGHSTGLANNGRPFLAGLMDITGSSSSHNSSLMTGFGARGGLLGGGLGSGTGGLSMGAVPSTMLLASAGSTSVVPACLAVIHPGWVKPVAQTGCAGGSTSAVQSQQEEGMLASNHNHKHAHAPGHLYRSLTDLQIARPDVLTVHGGLVLVGSSICPAVVQVFVLHARDGLRLIQTISLTAPGLRPADVRIRGLAIIPLPVMHGAAVQRVPQQMVLVALMGQLDRSGAPITALSRTGSAAPVRMTPLVVSVHALPKEACRAAMVPCMHQTHGLAPAAASTLTPCQSTVCTAGNSGDGPDPADMAHDLSPADRLTAVSATPSQAVAAPSQAVASMARAVAGSGPAAPNTGPASAPAPPHVPDMAAFMSQLGGMLAGLQAHMDTRIDGLHAELLQHKRRMDKLEAAVQGDADKDAAGRTGQGDASY